MRDAVVEFCCKGNLLKEGVPASLLQDWYDAAYINPDLSGVKNTIIRRIAGMEDSDIFDLLMTYGEDGSMAMLKEATKYFSKIYGVVRRLPIIEDEESGIEVASCVATFRWRRLEEMYLTVNPRKCKDLDGAALLIMIAHEIWHAWQFERLAAWLSALDGARIDFDMRPNDAEREKLYYLNEQRPVYCGESISLYKRQIFEAEANYATAAMTERLRRFSALVLERALRSMEVAGCR